MIPVENYDTRADEEALARFLETELESVLSEIGSHGFSEYQRPVSEAVARYLCSSGRRSFDSRETGLLLARAMWSLGKEDMAQHLLEKLQVESGMPGSAVGAVSGTEAAFVVRKALVSAGAVRSSSTLLSEESGIWILDMRRLVTRCESGIELTIFRCLLAAIDSMADVWDATSGKGLLGLRHTTFVAGEMLGFRGRRRRMLIRELLGLCRDKMVSLRVEREWVHLPEVVNLDLE